MHGDVRYNRLYIRGDMCVVIGYIYGVPCAL